VSTRPTRLHNRVQHKLDPIINRVESLNPNTTWVTRPKKKLWRSFIRMRRRIIFIFVFVWRRRAWSPWHPSHGREAWTGELKCEVRRVKAEADEASWAVAAGYVRERWTSEAMMLWRQKWGKGKWPKLKRRAARVITSPVLYSSLIHFFFFF
jgi:hypothetical protein